MAQRWAHCSAVLCSGSGGSADTASSSVARRRWKSLRGERWPRECGSSSAYPSGHSVSTGALQSVRSLPHGGGELCPTEHEIYITRSRGSLSYVPIHAPWSRRVPALNQPLQFPASGCPPPPWAWPAASRPGRWPCFGPRTASHPPAPRRPSLGPYLSPEPRPGRAGPQARAAWRRPRVPGPLELRDSPEQIFAAGRGARQGWGHPAAGTRGKGRGRSQGRTGGGA